nr:ATP-binding cassette domain-containing protein [Mesorhizobium sp.]
MGVGKTSLMRSIAGHHRLTSGSVAFEWKALERSAAYDRARSGIAFVPQGREIFPLLTVRENLESGFAPLKRADRNVPAHVFGAVSRVEADARPPRRRFVRRPAAATRHRPRAGDAPKLLVLDEPTEGIQPSIIKDIGRAIPYLRDQAGIAVLLVEQYLEFCRELADEVNIMDRGQIVHTGPAEDLDRPDVRKLLTV